MRSSHWVLAVVLSGGAVIGACASSEEPGAAYGSGGSNASGGGFGGAGDGGDSSRSANAQSGPGPTSVTSVTSTSGVTTSTTTSSSTTTSTSTGDTTTSSSTGEPPCQDQGPGEPSNDTRAGAHDLGDITDSDDAGGQVTGNLREPGDVDWYVYTGEDTSFNSVDPFRQVAGPGIRACMFIQCIEGDAEFDCPSDTVAETDGATPGCCWNGTTEVNIGGFNCNGPIDDDAQVFMKIEHPGGPGCESYTINYHY